MKMVAMPSTITAALAVVAEVKLVDEVIDYIRKLIRGTRGVDGSGKRRVAACRRGAGRRRPPPVLPSTGEISSIPDDVKALAPALLRIVVSFSRPPLKSMGALPRMS